MGRKGDTFVRGLLDEKYISRRSAKSHWGRKRRHFVGEHLYKVNGKVLYCCKIIKWQSRNNRESFTTAKDLVCVVGRSFVRGTNIPSYSDIERGCSFTHLYFVQYRYTVKCYPILYEFDLTSLNWCLYQDLDVTEIHIYTYNLISGNL